MGVSPATAVLVAEALKGSSPVAAVSVKPAVGPAAQVCALVQASGARQSAEAWHLSPLAQGAHEPPQSMSVSLPFAMPSLQLGTTSASCWLASVPGAASAAASSPASAPQS